MVEDVQNAGHRSLGAIAEELNARGILTRRGGRWHKSTVMNLLKRLGCDGGWGGALDGDLAHRTAA